MTVNGVRRDVAHRGGTGDRPVLRLDGVGSREAVEQLRGADLMVDRGAAPPLAEDEWLAEDLTGCRVRDRGREIGVVEALLPYPSCDLLEVRREGASSVLIPLIDDAVRSVDIDTKSIDVDARFIGLDADGAA